MNNLLLNIENFFILMPLLVSITYIHIIYQVSLPLPTRVFFINKQGSEMKTLTKKHIARSNGFKVRAREIEHSERYNNIASKWEVYEQRKKQLWDLCLPTAEYDTAIQNLIEELGL